MRTLLNSFKRDWRSWNPYERASAVGIVGAVSAGAVMALHQAL
ncbi:hypothetical protein [Azospirillum sp. SYSU D00513]|nr:hypothetical protein [Azospirillum sp. SYSU D00513]